MSYYYPQPQQQPIAAPPPAYHYPQPATYPQPVYYPQPAQAQPVYHAQPQYVMPQQPPPVYQRSNSSTSSFGGSSIGSSSFGSMGAVEGRNDEERMYYSTLKVLNEQVNLVYQSKLVHGWSDMSIIAKAIHRHAEGLRRKGKIADEIIDHISALLDEEAFDLEARYEEQGGDYWALSSAIRWVRAVVLVFQAEAIDIYFPTYAAEQQRKQQEDRDDDRDDQRGPRRRQPKRRGTQSQRGGRRRR